MAKIVDFIKLLFANFLKEEPPVHNSCIFQPAFGCCALQTLLAIVIFTVFSAKKLKKQEICSKFLQKTRLKFTTDFSNKSVFKFAPQC